MSTFLQLALILAALLASAKLAGAVAVRLGQPSVLGELLVGLLLGPTLINLVHLPIITDPALGEIVAHLGEMGVLLLMFLAGLELHLDELARNTRVAALAGTLGVIFPVGMGWGVGRLFGFTTPAAIFLGLTMGATSVSISAQTLMELKALRSRVGLGLLGAAVFDDVLVILLLSSFLALVGGGGSLAGVLWILLRMILFLGLSVVFGVWGLPWLVRWVARLPVSQAVLSLAVIVLLLYGVAAEVIGGMAAITGAFLAGLMFGRQAEKRQFESGMSALAYGLFVPIFFVSIGLQIDLRGVDLATLWLLLAVSLVAVIGKLFGAGLGARLARFSWRESVQMGAGMVSRGEVGLIVATVGISQALVSPAEFSAVVGMVVITTLITPVMLRLLFQREMTPAPANGVGRETKGEVE